MRQLIDLQDFWIRHKAENLALCTLVGKQGSSYRALGAKKLVALNSPDSCGLLSGGCLENDIEQTARENIAAMPFVRSFSTMSETDRLLGYQTGCAGVLDILFEKLAADADMPMYLAFGDTGDAAGVEIGLGPGLGLRRIVKPGEAAAAGNFIDPWVNPITLSIIGCGSDAPAFAELAAPLGWNLQFFDYRSDHQLQYKFAHQAQIISLHDMPAKVPAGPQCAAVLMTHNYEADMAILAGLTGTPIGYLGCLGPASRYAQMKADLHKLRGLTIDPAWEAVVHAPPGLLPKQRTPQTIALSIIADIQQTLADHG